MDILLNKTTFISSWNTWNKAHYFRLLKDQEKSHNKKLQQNLNKYAQLLSICMKMKSSTET